MYFEYLDKCRMGGAYNEDDKFSFADYLEQFLSLITSMKQLGYSDEIESIHINQGIPVNGAHRIAVGTQLQLSIPTISFKEYSEVQDYNFLKSVGITEVYLDASLQEFTNYQPNTRAYILLNERKNEANNIQNYLKMNSNFLAFKTIPLTQIGMRRIVDLMYSHNEWWDDKLIERFVFERFENAGSSTATIFLYVSRFDEESLVMKKILRRDFVDGGFERRLHGSDAQSDTKLLTDVFFNKNSLHFLNFSPVGSEKRILGKLANDTSNYDYTNMCLAGSTTLELYGIRIAKDLDLATLSYPNAPEDISGFELTNYGSFITNESSLVLDPRFHVTYKGLKFASLTSVQTLKQQRCDEKDILDNALILSFHSMTKELYFSQTFKSEASKAYRSDVRIQLRNKLLAFVPVRLKRGMRKLLISFLIPGKKIQDK